MKYANTNYIPLIFASVVAACVFFVWAANRRARLTWRFADKELFKDIAPSVSSVSRTVKMVMLVAVIGLSVTSLARPQWGFEWEEMKMTGLDIVIAMDVSKSMLATDMKPNRLERAKYAVKDLMKKLNGDRIGLIAFAGTAFLQCPPTIDYDGFMLSLDDISTSIIPRGGTNITAAIREAVNVLNGPEGKYKALVIITDGEDLEGDSQKAAKEASDAGIKIFCVGVGTFDGELIPAVGENGERGYLTDRMGDVVKTKLNEELLKLIAISTGGSYIRATQSEFGLLPLYTSSVSRLEKRDLESKMKKRYHERYQYFLSIAVLLLIIEYVVSDRRRVQR